MQPIARHEFRLPIVDESHLKQFIRLAWGIEIPDVQVCPHHSTPWRAFCDAYFAHNSVVVWKASRGFGGKSFLLSLLALTEAVTLKADVNVLGGSGEQSENVHRYNQEYWTYQGAPASLLVSDPSKRETKLRWGNTIKALMASQRSVRGPHPQRLRLDEVDEMALGIFDAAMGQTMADRGIAAQTVISSTHQYPAGTMTEALKRAWERNWPVHEWCYRESLEPHGWLAASEVERKRGEVTRLMWETEYDLQEPSAQDRAIDKPAVESMFRQELGEMDGGNREYIELEAPVYECEACGLAVELPQEIEPVCPRCGGRLAQVGEYTTGADWARKRDFTVIVTIRDDVCPARVVAYELMGRMGWPLMVGRFNERLRRYPGRGFHDGTGIGDVVAGYLEVGAEPVLMVGRTRSDMLTEYIGDVERNMIESARIESLYQAHNASYDDVFGAGHLPDPLAATALAWRGVRDRPDWGFV